MHCSLLQSEDVRDDNILKRERYYGRRFTSKQELIDMIQNYILYYNTRRVQRNLGVLTPMEKRNRLLTA